MIIFFGMAIGFLIVELNLTSNSEDEFWMDYAARRYDLIEY